jgi:hypothetical protein
MLRVCDKLVKVSLTRDGEKARQFSLLPRVRAMKISEGKYTSSFVFVFLSQSSLWKNEDELYERGITCGQPKSVSDLISMPTSEFTARNGPERSVQPVFTLL